MIQELKIKASAIGSAYIDTSARQYMEVTLYDVDEYRLLQEPMIQKIIKEAIETQKTNSQSFEF